MSEKTPSDLDWEMAQTILSHALRVDPRYSEALQAAAVPHWFDDELLAALLDSIPSALEVKDAAEDKPFAWLIKRPFVERYYQPTTTEESQCYTLHERTRRTLISHLRQGDPVRFLLLSERVRRYHKEKLEGQNVDPLEREVHYFEMIYHWLAVDDDQAFDALMGTYDILESQHRLHACGRLLALAEEQYDVLKDDRPLWLCYYQGRFLARSRRLPEALDAWEPLLRAGLTSKLKSLLASQLKVVRESQDFQKIGDQQYQARTLNDVGVALQSLDEWTDALTYHEEALQIFRQSENRKGEAETLNNIGAIYRVQHKWGEALSKYQAALEISHDLANQRDTAVTLNNLGSLYQLEGKLIQAQDSYQAAIKIFHELGDQYSENITLANMGELYTKKGEWELAWPILQQALQTAQELGDRRLEASVWHSLGELHKGLGKLDEAITGYNQALKLRHELNDEVGIDETKTALDKLSKITHSPESIADSAPRK